MFCCDAIALYIIIRLRIMRIQCNTIFENVIRISRKRIIFLRAIALQQYIFYYNNMYLKLQHLNPRISKFHKFVFFGCIMFSKIVLHRIRILHKRITIWSTIALQQYIFFYNNMYLKLHHLNQPISKFRKFVIFGCFMISKIVLLRIHILHKRIII